MGQAAPHEERSRHDSAGTLQVARVAATRHPSLIEYPISQIRSRNVGWAILPAAGLSGGLVSEGIRTGFAKRPTQAGDAPAWNLLRQGDRVIQINGQWRQIFWGLCSLRTHTADPLSDLR